MKVLAVALTAVVAVATSACCDKTSKRLQPHWLRTTENRYLALANVLAADKQVPVASSELSVSWLDHQTFDLEIGTQHYGFWLDLTNKSDRPIRLLWPDARYVDEKGVEHTLFAQERGALPDDRAHLMPPPPQGVAPSQRVRPTVVPIYKQYLVASGCRDLYPYSEPLIPTRLDDKNEQQLKAYVDDLAKRQVPVKLVLPIEIDGKRYDYAFTFVLKRRWEGLPRQ